MKKIWIYVLTAAVVLSLGYVGLFADTFDGFNVPPFTFLPTLTTVGGVVYDDVISGYKWGDWGLGGNYTVVNLNFNQIPILQDWKWLTVLNFGTSAVAFEGCNATTWSAFYDITPDIQWAETKVLGVVVSPTTNIKTGLFFGIDTGNPSHYLGGAQAQIGVFSLGQ